MSAMEVAADNEALNPVAASGRLDKEVEAVNKGEPRMNKNGHEAARMSGTTSQPSPRKILCILCIDVNKNSTHA